MDEIIVMRELNRHDDDMLTGEISVSATCSVYLKETSDAHHAQFTKKFTLSTPMLVKIMEWIFCAVFVSKLKMVSKVKLILKSICQKKENQSVKKHFPLLIWKLLCEFLFLTLTRDEVVRAVYWQL